MDKKDRRMFERFEFDCSTEFKQPEAKESNFAQCCDISAAGVGLLTEKEFIPNANLTIWLKIQDTHAPFRGVARVVWSKQVQENKWRSGLEFETIDFMGLRRIFATLTPRTLA